MAQKYKVKQGHTVQVASGSLPAGTVVELGDDPSLDRQLGKLEPVSTKSKKTTKKEQD